jgi:hypothetical protein
VRADSITSDTRVCTSSGSNVRSCIEHFPFVQYLCTPRGEHGTVNDSSIFGPEEVGGKGRHGAKAPTVAERNDGRWNEGQGKAGNRWQDGEDESLNDEHAQEGERPSNAIREPAPPPLKMPITLTSSAAVTAPTPVNFCANGEPRRSVRPSSAAHSHESLTSLFEDKEMSVMGLLCVVQATQLNLAVA